MKTRGIGSLNGNEREKGEKVLAALDEIETEMKRIGFWEERPPKVQGNGYLDAPSFELWLQCVFVPDAREAARKGKYPQDSEVGLMAVRQYDYHGCVEEALNLVRLLNDFDRLIKEK